MENEEDGLAGAEAAQKLKMKLATLQQSREANKSVSVIKFDNARVEVLTIVQSFLGRERWAYETRHH